jgi:hypothetical protein
MTVASSKLPPLWRDRAKELRPYSEAAAHAYEMAAIELEQAERVSDSEYLNLTQAAKESGYRVRHLRNLIRRGVLKNHGRKGAPRLKREDLPKKATALAQNNERPNLRLEKKAIGSRSRR